MMNTAQLRKFTADDYAVLEGWWKAYDWAPIPPAMLPATGYIVEDLCAGFLYKTDSCVSLIEWVIANPNADKVERNLAVSDLIDKLCEEAKATGFQVVIAMTAHERLINRYESKGFVKNTPYVAQLTRVL